MAAVDDRNMGKPRLPDLVEQARTAMSGIDNRPRIVIDLPAISANRVFRIMSPRLADRKRAADFIMDVAPAVLNCEKPPPAL